MARVRTSCYTVVRMTRKSSDGRSKRTRTQSGGNAPARLSEALERGRARPRGGISGGARDGRPVHRGTYGAVLALILGACNMVTGADDYVIGDDDDGSSSNASSNSSATGVGGAAAGAGGAGTGAGVNTMDLLPSDAASITSIDIYQGVRRPMMDGGAAVSSSVPLVGGREAVMRIHYTTSAPVTVTTVVTIGDGSPIVLSSSLSGTSSLSALSSTINVDIPAEMMVPGVGYSVELLESPETTSGANASATFPVQGLESLPVQNVGALKLVLIPIAYGADGSNRVPDAQANNYRTTIRNLFPVPDVEVAVTGTFQWNSQVSANGSGWGSLLDAIANYRQSNNAASNEHYYGIVMPSASFSSYCAGGCVAGLSMLANSPNDSWARAGIGVGFTGLGSTESAAHEIGHQHGRGHAPCQVNDADPSYPYSGGAIGDWGYDLARSQLVNPSTTDFMGYCDPTWISDYTFKGLFSRLAAVNASAQLQFDPSQLNLTYERIRIDADGVTWGEPITLVTPPMGELKTVTVTDEVGDQTLSGRFYPYSHLPGGVLLFPRQQLVARVASFDIQGLRTVAERVQAVAD